MIHETKANVFIGGNCPCGEPVGHAGECRPMIRHCPSCSLMNGWIDSLLMGGNHLAVILSDSPTGWERWTNQEAIEKFGGGYRYDVWCAWKQAMKVSQERRAIFGE